MFVKCRDEDDDREGTWEKALDHTEAIDSWHLDIEQEQVGTAILHGSKGSDAIRAFADDFYTGMLAKHATKPAAGKRLIIHDQCPKFDHQVRKGIVTSTVTPLPLVRV